MKAQERCDILKSTPVSQFVKGEKRPPFPETVDNTMRSAFLKCQRSLFNEHLLCRVGGTDNIHLVAGAAYAAAHDAFRKSYFSKGTEHYRNFERALEDGVYELIKHYGYDEARESSEAWQGSAKSCERMLVAFLDYWTEYHPKLSVGKMYFHDGEVASEIGGLIPLRVKHPVTGEFLQMSFRFDYVEDRNGQVWLGDDKTTSSLGQSWAKQWDMRAQFLGYTYAAREVLGIPAVGVIARGTGILKTSIKHMEVPVSVPPYLADRWYEQVNKDFQRIVDAYVKGEWDYDMADGCAAYGGCKFVDSCRSKFPHKVLGSMPIRVWNPEDPENSPVVRVEEL